MRQDRGTTIRPVLTRRRWLHALAGLAAAPLGGGRALARQARGPGAAPDPTTLSLAELSRAYAAGTLTPLDVTAAYLARIDRENGRLGAYVTVSRDRAVDETRRLLRVGGTFARGPLYGAPLAQKVRILYGGSMKPANAECIPRGHAFWRPRKHFSPNVGTMMQTGSTRG